MAGAFILRTRSDRRLLELFAGGDRRRVRGVGPPRPAAAGDLRGHDRRRRPCGRRRAGVAGERLSLGAGGADPRAAPVALRGRAQQGARRARGPAQLRAAHRGGARARGPSGRHGAASRARAGRRPAARAASGTAPGAREARARGARLPPRRRRARHDAGSREAARLPGAPPPPQRSRCFAAAGHPPRSRRGRCSGAAGSPAGAGGDAQAWAGTRTRATPAPPGLTDEATRTSRPRRLGVDTVTRPVANTSSRKRSGAGTSIRRSSWMPMLDW